MLNKPPKRKKINAQQLFLAHYKLCGLITMAAEASGIHHRRHYDWLADPDYRKQFEDAEDIATDRALAEVRRRAIDGIEEPVIYQGGLCYPTNKDGKPAIKPLTVKKYSDNLLMFLVKGKRPEYRDSWKGELNLKGDIRTTNINLTKVPDDKLDQLIAILESAGDAAAAGYTLASGLNGKVHESEESDS